MKSRRYCVGICRVVLPFKNGSVQLVARNHECPKALNNVPCVIWSCNKLHATHGIVNYAFEVNQSCNRYNKKPVLSVSQSQVFLIALWQYYCFIPPNAPRDLSASLVNNPVISWASLPKKPP